MKALKTFLALALFAIPVLAAEQNQKFCDRHPDVCVAGVTTAMMQAGGMHADICDLTIPEFAARDRGTAQHVMNFLLGRASKALEMAKGNVGRLIAAEQDAANMAAQMPGNPELQKLSDNLAFSLAAARSIVDDRTDHLNDLLGEAREAGLRTDLQPTQLDAAIGAAFFEHCQCRHADCNPAPTVPPAWK